MSVPHDETPLCHENGCYDHGRPTIVREASLAPVIGRLAPKILELGFLFPNVITLCGSTRFSDEFVSENRRLTRAGNVVLSVAFFGHSEVGTTLTGKEKSLLDFIHLRKIDLSDAIHVINVGGYVGDSTRREILHALDTKKEITWLEPDKAPGWALGGKR